MTFTIPLYKRKTTMPKQESKLDKVIDEVVKEKAKVATDAAIEQVEKTAKDKLSPLKKLAFAIGVAGAIALMTSCGQKVQAGSKIAYIYGDHCTVNL